MGDWRVKHDGECARCGAPLRRGMPAVWDRATRTIHCLECPTDAGATTSPTVDEGIAGRSARAEYQRRAATRRAGITERWGEGLAAKVVRAVTREPQSTRAWASGAAGEERLAAELARIPGLRAFHDRRVRGTKGNIDHIVVAPGGVFVVDAKNHRGRVEIRSRGWLLRPDNRLMVGGRDCSDLATKMTWQVAAVTAAMREGGVDPMPPVIPVLCFVEADWPLLAAPDEYAGVRLESLGSIRKLLTREAVLDDVTVEATAVLLAAALPPK